MSLIKLYNYFNNEVADPRTNDWFIVRSPVPVLLITFSYLYFVLRCGPRFMKDRTPYKLKGFIRCYNIFQIMSNAWAVYAILEAGWYDDYFLYCVHEEKFLRTPQTYKFTIITWYLLYLKIIDYIETGLFVLRKKNNQISFLHLFHHVSTVIFGWLCIKYFISGMGMTVPLVNSVIHVIMYTYYLLSSFGPSMQKLTAPIKPFITIAQMVQFVFLSMHAVRAYIPGCPGQEINAGILIVLLIINFILFYDFYHKSYVKKQKQKLMRTNSEILFNDGKDQNIFKAVICISKSRWEKNNYHSYLTDFGNNHYQIVTESSIFLYY
ncbi:very long chain fatty acid elongase 1-like [Xylocopa sonorina]|uniref:very long chain fatty acid elongase 1-like n=1 Tax=Xylocopa sonorina TaxID=1818115 RepID=UPI00403AAB7F